MFSNLTVGSSLYVRSSALFSGNVMIADSAIISGTAYIYGSMTVIGTLSATLSGVAASAQFATSAGHAQSATSAVFAQSATSAAFAQSATSAAFAQSATSAAFAVSYQFHGALIMYGSAQALANGTTTAVSWGSVVYDTLGFFSTTSATVLRISTGVSRIRLAAQVAFQFSGTTTSYHRLLIQKNSANFSGMPFVNVYGASNITTILNAYGPPVSVVSGDSFEVYVRQNQGVTMSLTSSDITTWFSLEVIQ